MKYTSAVRDAIKDFYKENLKQEITDEQIEELPRGFVLELYLEWEGIIGYTWIIKNICGLN